MINWNNIDYRTSTYLISYHLIVLIGLPIYLFYRTPSWGLVLITIVLLFATGMSITAGYHRLYAHKAYQANKTGEFFLLLFGTMAMQSTVAYWAHKHRLHHRFADKEGDPHNINKGFWHAHIGWLFQKQIPIDWSIIPDLKKNKLVMFQKKYYHVLAFGLNILVFLLLGWIFKDFWGALIIGWWTRVFVLSHSTYFINSLAHMWGAKTYSKEQTAVNNAVIAFLTFGEGYHNYHHVFASDYRNGVRWYQYDPTKWLIWAFSKIGLANGLKKINKYISKNKIIMEDRHIFLEALKDSTYERKQQLEKKVVDTSEKISTKIFNIKNAIQEYKTLKQKDPKDARPLKKRIKELQQTFKDDWRSWRKLEREVSRHVVLHHHH
jgi:stearoyl-CoA desaturase (Delta-9 desaturase)